MRRRTISEHQSDQSASINNSSKNSRLLGYYNNLQSSFEQDNSSFQRERNQNHNYVQDSYSRSHSSYSSSRQQSIDIVNNSKQTLKNKGSRLNQFEPTGHRLIDTSSYLIPQPQRRRVRSFLNQSVREKSRISRYQRNQSFSNKLEQSSIRQSNQQQLITLPQAPIDNSQVGYLMFLNRHKALAKPYDFAKKVIKRNHQISMVEEFEKQKGHHRCYESAKLRYHDLMMPADKLKVGNNALKMYKYRQKKRGHSRLIQLADI